MLKKTTRNLLTSMLLLIAVSHAHAASPPVILIMGDSLSAGYGVNLRNSWASLLQNRLRNTDYPYHVINASVSGDTTGGGRARLPQLLNRHNPKIVILELGGNDGLRGLPIPSIKDNLTAMIKLCHRHNSHIILLGMQIPGNLGRIYTEKFKSLYPALAGQHSTALVPFFLDKIADRPAYMQADQIHPNETAQIQLLENVWPVLKPLLAKKPDA